VLGKTATRTVRSLAQLSDTYVGPVCRLISFHACFRGKTSDCYAQWRPQSQNMCGTAWATSHRAATKLARQADHTIIWHPSIACAASMCMAQHRQFEFFPIVDMPSVRECGRDADFEEFCRLASVLMAPFAPISWIAGVLRRK
jgi:hypothetical protein